MYVMMTKLKRGTKVLTNVFVSHVTKKLQKTKNMVNAYAKIRSWEKYAPNAHMDLTLNLPVAHVVSMLHV